MIALILAGTATPTYAQRGRLLRVLFQPLNRLRGCCEPCSEENDPEAGFVSIFNGKDLEGWQGATDGYYVENETIISKEKSGGNLYTKDEYADFSFRFDFKLTSGANNGVGLRTPLNSNAAYDGMESQILDDTAEKYSKLKKYQYHGSIYGVVPAKKGHLNPIGEWNSEEIICKGTHVKVILNGVTIVDADIAKASTPKTLDGKAHPGLKRKSGYLAFCGHGARIEFRNLRVKKFE
jgi:hypothetical protein